MGLLHENGWFWAAVGVLALICTVKVVSSGVPLEGTIGMALMTPVLVFGAVIFLFLLLAFLTNPSTPVSGSRDPGDIEPFGEVERLR